MFFVVIFSVIVIAVIVVMFMISVLRQHKIMLKWQQARIAAEINTLESDRKRIAGDLHDELGPILSAIQLQINHLEPANKSEAEVLEKSSKQIDGVIQRFREISYNLLPNTLVRKGFVKATEEFISKLKTLHPLKIEFTPMDFVLPPEMQVNMYRVVQEIIQNTIKHARATVLVINIEKKPRSLLLQTRDDGIGFNYSEKTQLAKGVGLLSLQSRAELLGGQLMVNTQPGFGTSFEIEIPL
jgi:signal transduction histidine kinase